MLALVEETFNSVLVKNNIKVLISSAHSSVSAPVDTQTGAACRAALLSHIFRPILTAAARASGIAWHLNVCSSQCLHLADEQHRACR